MEQKFNIVIAGNKLVEVTGFFFTAEGLNLFVHKYDGQLRVSHLETGMYIETPYCTLMADTIGYAKQRIKKQKGLKEILSNAEIDLVNNGLSYPINKL